MKAKGTSKIPIFKHFSGLGKIWECSQAFQKSQSTTFMNWEKLGSIRNPRPTFQNPNFESIDVRICPNLSFTVHFENKMDNLHKEMMVIF